MAAGDLTENITADFEDGFAKIKSCTDQLVERLREIMLQLSDTSGLLRTATRQAAAIEQTAVSMEDLSRTVSQNAVLSAAASDRAKKAAESAEAGGQVMGKVTEAMEKISSSSRRISNIIGIAIS